MSEQGTNLRLTVKAAKKGTYLIAVERRIVDRKTGELSIEEREREVSASLWPHLTKAYKREK